MLKADSVIFPNEHFYHCIAFPDRGLRHQNYYRLTETLQTSADTVAYKVVDAVLSSRFESMHSIQTCSPSWYIESVLCKDIVSLTSNWLRGQVPCAQRSYV